MSDINVRTLSRMLQLRQLALFEHADLDELATIAENLVEFDVPAGTVIAPAGARLRSIHIVVDGCIETEDASQSWGPRQAFGALEVFANRELEHTAVAASPLRTLQLAASDLGELLEDNYGVLLATVRQLAGRLLGVQERSRRTDAGPEPPSTERALGLVERLIVFRRQLPFATARLQALASLAHASDEISYAPGAVIARAGDAAGTAFVILSGAASFTRGAHTEVLGPGDSIGYFEALAGADYHATVHATSSVRVLRSHASTFLDVIEDHTDVGLAMLATFSEALLNGPAEPDTRTVRAMAA